MVLLFALAGIFPVEAQKKCRVGATFRGRVDRVLRNGDNGHIAFFDLWTTKDWRGYYQVHVSELLYGLLLESGKVKLLREGRRVAVRIGGCDPESPAIIKAEESWNAITATR